MKELQRAARKRQMRVTISADGQLLWTSIQTGRQYTTTAEILD
ncbi:MAG: hypothetical protein NTU97_00200 [Candidatus Magasanikbacteria bacterium]|nr:hypothetical protein [Candidatus Magasanikbacteria bacterium]